MYDLWEVFLLILVVCFGTSAFVGCIILMAFFAKLLGLN